MMPLIDESGYSSGFEVGPRLNPIPPLTVKPSPTWHQPADIHEAPMDNDSVLLTRDQFNALTEYDVGDPPIVRPGICWKSGIYRHNAGRLYPVPVRWYLRWYHGTSTLIYPVCSRQIVVGRLKDGV